MGVTSLIMNRKSGNNNTGEWYVSRGLGSTKIQFEESKSWISFRNHQEIQYIIKISYGATIPIKRSLSKDFQNVSETSHNLFKQNMKCKKVVKRVSAKSKQMYTSWKRTNTRSNGPKASSTSLDIHVFWVNFTLIMKI